MKDTNTPARRMADLCAGLPFWLRTGPHRRRPMATRTRQVEPLIERARRLV